jgi:hypothetical protein
VIRGFTGNSWPDSAVRICAGANQASWRVTDESSQPYKAFQKHIDPLCGFQLT